MPNPKRRHSNTRTRKRRTHDVMGVLQTALDPNCPLGGAQIAFSSAEAAYRQAGAPEKLKILVAPGVAHKVTDDQRQAALDWLVKWLAIK